MKQFEDDKVTLDAGCAERSCACYSPQFGDTGGVPHYPESVVTKLLDRIAELEKQIEDAVEIGIAEGFAKALTQYPRYTTPHHASDVKQTKPLSDKEIIDFIKSWEGLVVTNRTVAMIRAIEAKVRGEK